MSFQKYPFEPKMMGEHKDNILAILDRVFDVSTDEKDAALAAEFDGNPDLLRPHTLDFFDGVRLLVTNELHGPPFGERLHVSASLVPGTELYKDALSGKLRLNRFIALVTERVRQLCNRTVTHGYVAKGGIPHFFDPALPPPAVTMVLVEIPTGHPAPAG